MRGSSNGTSTFLLMPHAGDRHWYSCYGNSKCNFGLNIRKLGARRFYLVSVALLISVAFLFAVEGGLKPLPTTTLPFYYYLGGAFVAFYVLSVTWVAPQFGVGNAVAFVLLGQLISMAAIDHFGLLGAPTHVITLQRFVGLILMSIGVFLAVRRG